MEALLVVGTLFQVVGSIQAGNQQAQALNRQAEMYMKQASVYNSQIELEQIENNRAVAIEKAAKANESLERTKRLQRIIGSTIASAASAGISTQYGTTTRLNEESMYESSIEEAIARDNSANRIISLNLNSATQQQNLANSAYGSVFQANEAYKSASQAKTKGFMDAAGSLMSYGMAQYGRGSTPAPRGNSTTLSNGEVINWRN